MSPSLDFSSLLCEEDDYGTPSDGDRLDPTWHHQGRRLNGPVDDFSGGDWASGLPVQSDECVRVAVRKETEHSPESDYLSRLRTGDLDLVSRKEAIDWISKVVAYYNFGPLCTYLAVSYLDRFLSVYDSSKGQTWLMQLLAVACLSLAAKMEENEVPLSLCLQVSEAKFVFEAKTIQRMELVVLSALKWRMQAITPFSFIDNFLYKINGENYPPQSVISQSCQLILSITEGIEFLEFRPSEIAAAVAVSVGLETQTVEVDKSMRLLGEYVQKDRVLQCLEMINESSFKRGFKEGQSGNLTPSVPRSPIGVLDITCMSYKSDDSTVGSCASSPHVSHGSKRRKLLV